MRTALGSAPSRVRIGLGGGGISGTPGYADPTTSAAFTWETPDATAAAKIRLGTDRGALTDFHTGYSWTTPAPTVGIGTTDPAPHMHEVHEYVADVIRRAQEAGGVPPERNPDAEAWIFIALGLLTMADEVVGALLQDTWPAIRESRITWLRGPLQVS